MPSRITPIDPAKIAASFDNEDWCFEIKMYGWGIANQELPRKMSKISKAFSAMITAAVNRASAATHQELANWPILLLSPVNCSGGTSANGN